MKNRPAIIFLFPDEKGNFLYHLGTAYIISYLKVKNIYAEQFVSNEFIGIKEIEEYIVDRKPRFIGFTCFNSNYFLVKMLSQYIKLKNPNVTVVLGGPSATFSDEEIMQNSDDIDICVRGEGEKTVYELIQTSRNDFGRILGITYRSNKKIVRNPDRPFIGNIDSVPSPYLNGIINPLDLLKVNNEVSILTSRGCIYRCTYCNFSAMSRYTIRYHSIDRVIKELQFIDKLLKRNNLRDAKILIQDDTFTLECKRVKEICSTILKKKISLNFWLLTRSDKVDKDLLHILFKAGFRDINFGLETAVPRILYNIKKARLNYDSKRNYRQERLFIQKTKKNVAIAKNIGFRVGVSIILGLPGENYKEGIKTINFVRGLAINTYAHNYLSIFQGTELFKTCRNHGLYLNKPRFKEMIFNDQTISPPRYPYDIRKIPLLKNEIQLNYNMRYTTDRIRDSLMGYYDKYANKYLRDIVVLAKRFPSLRNIENAALETRFIYGRNLNKLMMQGGLGKITLIASTVSGFSPQYRLSVNKLQEFIPQHLKFEYKITDCHNNGKILAQKKILRISNEEDLEYFLSYQNATRNYILLDACRWSDYCPAKYFKRLIIDESGRLFPCFQGKCIGRIGENLTVIQHRLSSLQKDEEKKRGCHICPIKENCSKCLFLAAMSAKAYCRSRLNHRHITDSLKSLRLLNKLISYAGN